MFINRINLPSPNQELIDALYEASKDEAAIAQYHQPWVSELNPNINCVSCLYLNSEDMLRIGSEQYARFFEDEILVHGAIFRNHNPETPAFYPPHVDAYRYISLNYILETGGDNVTTSFYTDRGPEEFYDGGRMSTFEDHDSSMVAEEYHLQKHQWYALDIQQYHSVNNVEYDRVAVMISFQKLLYKDLLLKYSHLLN